MARLHSGEATNADRAQFDAWLAEHPAHSREFKRVTTIWNTLDRVKPFLETELKEAESMYHTGHVPDSRHPLPHWSRRLITAGAFATLIILVAAWWLTLPPQAIRHQTAKGEQRQVTLDDGSTVTLNTASEIIAQFSDKERLVVLDHGEAWFEVLHDEQRPFRVQVANGVVQDIGTQFIVNKSPEKVTVSVLEGIVEVQLLASPASSIAARPALLHHGEQLWYDADGRVSSVGTFNRTVIGAWRGGKVIFQRQPLGQVLAEIARYRPEEIRVVDPGLNAIPVSGMFNIQDVQSFVQALNDALPIQATWVNPQLIIVERAPAAVAAPKIPAR